MWFGAVYNKDNSVIFRILPPYDPPSSGGILGRAELLQRPRPLREKTDPAEPTTIG